MTSNFERSKLLRPNSVLGVLRLYGKPIESKFQPYACVGHRIPELARKGQSGRSGRLSG